MSPGSPDASDELQVIPRRPSGGPPAPPERGGGFTASDRLAGDPARKRRLTRVVVAALGACAAILVAAGIARAVRPHEASVAAIPIEAPTPTTTAAPPAPAATVTATPAAPPTPTTGTLYFDRPATPGKVWLDGKKVTSKSVETSCGKHQVKIGASGKAKSVSIPCGGELHLSR